MTQKTIRTYVGDAVTTIFPVDFTLGYINRDYVYVYLTGNAYNTELTYTWINSSQIELTTPVASGVEFNIRRVVPRDTLVNAYEDGAILRGKNLDDSNLQHLMLQEEISETGVYTVNDFVDISGTTAITPTAKQMYRINLLADATLNLSTPPTLLLASAIQVVFFINPKAHAIGFSSNIDWGDVGLPDFRANTVSSFTLVSYGGHAKWLGFKGNGGFAG